MIISGYQGVGKSTLAVKSNNFIDLESSSFFVDGVRPDNWYVMYCQVAINLSQQGHDVFVSSHKVVRDYLADHSDEKLVLVFPDKDLKSQWIDRLQKRYDQTKSDKDYKALKNAECSYDSNILDLMNQSGFKKIILIDTSYKLSQCLDAVRYSGYASTPTFLLGD